MFNKGQLAGLMKQAQAMQDNLKKAQEELAHIEVEGESGAGLVKVLMTCKHDVKRITIDPSLLADDKDMLEDLVAAAFNAAVRKAEEVSEQKMGKLTAGLPPGTPVAHKTGDITGIHHDAAIVFPPGEKPYVLVILTAGFQDEEEADKAIADEAADMGCEL